MFDRGGRGERVRRSILVCCALEPWSSRTILNSRGSLRSLAARSQCTFVRLILRAMRTHKIVIAYDFIHEFTYGW